MKDLYSFHESEEDLEKFFEKMIAAYEKIFNRVGIKPIITKASGGTIGGSTTYEFQAPTKVGEDTVYLNKETGKAFNKEIEGEIPEDEKKDYEAIPAVEAGQVFSLGTKYSEAMDATFVDKNGQKKPLVMGCYGIGLGRLLATIVEAFHDDRGIVWPTEVSPFAVHLVSLGNNEKVNKEAEKIYEKLNSTGVEVLYDDREESAGVKLGDADLIGIPERWVVSEKTLAEDSLEVKKRNSEETSLQKISSI